VDWEERKMNAENGIITFQAILQNVYVRETNWIENKIALYFLM
jgi:hypothetical protein